MNNVELANRISRVERRMDAFETRVGESVAALGTQVVQLRDDMNLAFSALRRDLEDTRLSLDTKRAAGDTETRASLQLVVASGDTETRRYLETKIIEGDTETRRYLEAKIIEGDAETRRYLETKIVEGDTETRTFMRVLHEDLVERIRLLGDASR